MDKHEMYCAGHMIEAAVAYYKATGKRKLLDVSVRMTEHMMSLFGSGKRHWVPGGHEEIELALVKLYEVTKEKSISTSLTGFSKREAMDMGARERKGMEQTLLSGFCTCKRTGGDNRTRSTSHVSFLWNG